MVRGRGDEADTRGRVPGPGHPRVDLRTGELATLAQERPWLVVVVFNDGGYGVLRNMQDAKESARRAVDLRNPDFALLCRSMGLHHESVADTDSFDRALAEAVERMAPAVIEIDVAALRPQPEPMVPPVNVP